MGTYATTTSLQTIMVGVQFDSLTTALADKMITHAENEVNKYLSKRYDLSSSPFDTSTSIPPLVTSLTETLAEAYMHHRMSRGEEENRARALEMIKSVTENLDKISTYQLDLIGADGSALLDFSNTAYDVRSSTVGYSSTFDEDDPLHWEIDQDKLDDIESERS